MPNEYPHVAISGRVRLGLLLVLLTVGAIAATGIISRMHHETELAQAAELHDIIPVKLIAPKPMPASQHLTLPGNLTPYYEAFVYSRVNGYLKIWYTDIGAHVKKGQLLAIVETPELDKQIQRAQSDLETAKARLELANITAERWKNLLQTDSVSRQEVDEKVQDAKAQQALVDAAKANLDSLRADQAFNHIVAPFDGVVTDRQTDIGMLISIGSSDSKTPLFHVADTHILRVWVDVPQDFASSIKVGSVAQVTFPDRPGKTYPARVVTTSQAIHIDSRTLTVELYMDNQGGEFVPGAYGDVKFTLPTHASTFILPPTTLLFRKGGLKVATVGPDNRVVLKSITIGRDLGKAVEVTSGIDANDRIIDPPSDSIANGDRVKVVDGKHL
jgi:RND family efflux transporter MFP subunit